MLIGDKVEKLRASDGAVSGLQQRLEARSKGWRVMFLHLRVRIPLTAAEKRRRRRRVKLAKKAIKRIRRTEKRKPAG